MGPVGDAGEYTPAGCLFLVGSRRLQKVCTPRAVVT